MTDPADTPAIGPLTIRRVIKAVALGLAVWASPKSYQPDEDAKIIARANVFEAHIRGPE